MNERFLHSEENTKITHEVMKNMINECTQACLKGKLCKSTDLIDYRHGAMDLLQKVLFRLPVRFELK